MMHQRGHTPAQPLSDVSAESELDGAQEPEDIGGRLEAGMAKLCCVSDRKKVCSGPMLARPSHPASVSAR